MTERVLTSEDYALWRHHPVTKVFLKYVEDFSVALEREAVDRWISGALKLIDEQEMRGRIMTLREISELPLSAIREFYKEEDETENAT
jgi:hypothetical protein